MTTFTPDEGLLGQVREGMVVLDPAGAEIGTVAAVRMGDPEGYAHVGEPGNDRAPLTEEVAAMFTPDSELTEQARARLAQHGYVRVDLKGLFAGTRYAEGEQVASVEGDAVRLTVGADELLR